MDLSSENDEFFHDDLVISDRSYVRDEVNL